MLSAHYCEKVKNSLKGLIEGKMDDINYEVKYADQKKVNASSGGAL